MGKIVGAYLMPHPPIILREIGKGEEKKIQSTITAMKQVAKDIKDKKPKTIIIITPHGPVFSDGIAISIKSELKGDMGEFGASHVKLSKDNNQELASKIIVYAGKKKIVCAGINDEIAREYKVSTKLDHGTIVPLYFVDKEYVHYKLVHITYGLLSYEDLYSFGKAIQEAVEDSDENVVVIASGDLSHRLKADGPYGYSPEGEKFDKCIIEFLVKEKIEEIIGLDENFCDKAGQCGLRSIDIMLGAIDGYEIKVDLLSYEGPFGVGYGVVKIDVGKKDRDKQLLDKLYKNKTLKIRKIREREDEYIKLARKSLEYYVKNKKKIDFPTNLSSELINNKAGVFVSIKKDGRLRGCIGTIEPTTENIAQEIIENAIKAGTEDPRFYPVEEDELDDLVYSVDILKKPELVSSLDELDEKKYGVIVSSGRRKGLLLPNIEGVNSVEEQIRIALRKAGISPNEGYSIQRFEVIRHK
ncbi:uncharacterized protein, PH0010 family/AmmeMemoRadiSam system protein A/AmmeMemoRadiSam system protein B [Caminicella sporogenes DSM 14501]|uniref:Uncharacterized protein, PH0010 family/AmmeMemoRadiSam system protein A/AmmeMemoRadiSam system protein B n=1 Tax=Caminicella sporogenes DSM 14501 TaxID=1121266 RepID=A0A1M6TE10_9FIRM|nr:AmmeMemoRadiSam system protein A [Caminicella sporogenes]RKD25402.1 AMMECR1 domain-containing protein [Caminicella sporogenes]SHK55104.1 uncharacterized protein, PH0010 family/AmmeMemoRadiSam system protein A/AmmeMemoRadiSam system protein B [Caminicella sporogenes DSM 14501]